MRSNDNAPAKSTLGSKYLSRLTSSANSNLSRAPQPTILALQCSDNTIRLYQLDLSHKIPAQLLSNEAKSLNEFLIPLRLLRDHTTGGQWPIRLSFRQGPLFHIATPQLASKPDSVPVISDSTQTKQNASSHSPFHPTQKQIMRVRATDATGLVTSMSSGSLAATSDDNPSSVAIPKPPKLASISQILLDDVSVNSDVSEPVGQTSQTNKLARQKLLEDSDDREGHETESLLSGKGTVSAEDGRDDDVGSVASDNGGADDSGDEETRLNMIAGLATSTLLTANNFESQSSSQQQSSKYSKYDGLDLLMTGSPNQKFDLNRNCSRSTDWMSSFVLATGSNNGQVPPPPLPYSLNISLDLSL